MADAKIINYGQQISAGSTAIPDNTSEALDIESTDANAEDYITIDTTEGSENMKFGVGAASDMMRFFSNGTIDTSQSNGYGIQAKTTASATAPVFIPNKNDPDTGIGRADADQLSLIAGGVEGIRLTEDTTILAEIKGRTVITADTSGTPDDLGDFDNYALVLQGSSGTNDETALLLSSSGNTYGGSAIVHKDTDAGGKGELSFYTKQSTSAEPPVKVLTLSDAGATTISGGVSLTGLPTSDPGVANRLWNDSGTLKISAG